MGKGSKPKYYAVKIGLKPGIYNSWEECQSYVIGHAGAVFKSFTQREQAENFMRGNSGERTQASASSIPQLVGQSGSGSTRSSTRSKVFEARQSRTEASVGGPLTGTNSGASSSAHGMLETVSTSTNTTSGDSYDDVESLVVYSDGACKGNGQPGSVAGIGVYFGQGDTRNYSERCPGSQTNNRAELIAIIRAIELSPKTAKRLTVKTDSRYSINCITKYLPGWIRKNFVLSTGDPVKNRGVIEYLAELIRAWEGRGPGARIDLVYVKGHSGEPGNEAADRLANMGVLLPERPDDGDWAKKKRRLEAINNALRRTA